MNSIRIPVPVNEAMIGSGIIDLIEYFLSDPEHHIEHPEEGTYKPPHPSLGSLYCYHFSELTVEAQDALTRQYLKQPESSDSYELMTDLIGDIVYDEATDILINLRNDNKNNTHALSDFIFNKLKKKLALASFVTYDFESAASRLCEYYAIQKKEKHPSQGINLFNQLQGDCYEKTRINIKK